MQCANSLCKRGMLWYEWALWIFPNRMWQRQLYLELRCQSRMWAVRRSRQAELSAQCVLFEVWVLYSLLLEKAFTYAPRDSVALPTTFVPMDVSLASVDADRPSAPRAVVQVLRNVPSVITSLGQRLENAKASSQRTSISMDTLTSTLHSPSSTPQPSKLRQWMVTVGSYTADSLH
jgi:hypothetical protein